MQEMIAMVSAHTSSRRILLAAFRIQNYGRMPLPDDRLLKPEHPRLGIAAIVLRNPKTARNILGRTVSLLLPPRQSLIYN